MTQSKALRIRCLRGSVGWLAECIEDFKYRHELAYEANKLLAIALNELASATAHLRETAAEQALLELEEGEAR